MAKFKNTESAKAHFVSLGYSEEKAQASADAYMLGTESGNEVNESVQKLAEDFKSVSLRVDQSASVTKEHLDKIEAAQVALEQRMMEDTKTREEAALQRMADVTGVSADNKGFAKDLKDRSIELQIRSGLRGIMNGKITSGEMTAIPVGNLPEIRAYFGFDTVEKFDKACADVCMMVDDDELQNRAMSGDVTGFGAELVKTVAGSTMIERLRVPSSLMGNITHMPITGESQTMPAEIADMQWRSGYLIGSGLSTTKISETDPETGEITWTPNQMALLTSFPDKFLEDNILTNWTSYIAKNMQASLSEQLDQAIIMGDKSTGATGNVNSDDATPATDAYFKFVKGMVTYCLKTGGSAWYQDTNAVLTLAHIDLISQAMGKYATGGNPCIALNPITAVFLKNLIGQQAGTNWMNSSVSNGVLQSISGLKAIITSGMKRTQADGKMSVTASNNTEMNGMAFNGNNVIYGDRRGLKVESFRSHANLVNCMVASFRADLQFSNAADTLDGYPMQYMYQKSSV